jgi:V8-like Glu-specific endopeptidase
MSGQGARRPARQVPGAGGRRLLRAVCLTTPLSLVLTIAAIAWLTVPAAPAIASLPVLATSVPFGGTPAVGALFTDRDGRLGRHFCTASVVRSPAGNLVLTAAHCLKGYPDTGPPGIAFVPGYYDGVTPSGVWPVTRIFLDAAWTATADPDDDFAFLTVAQPGRDIPIQSVTGAEILGSGGPSAGLVRVIGYPNDQNEPIICQNRTSRPSPSRTQFDCDSFTVGTSGSPFLTGSGGVDTVTGVIGGYQLGGDKADVSYTSVFGNNVQALYDTSISQR